MTQQIKEYLASVPPFSLVPADEIERLSKVVETRRIEKGKILAEQGKTVVENVYILMSGMLELYYDNKGEKIISGILKKGGIFGGISILMNSGIAVRTVSAIQDTECCILPRKEFIALCSSHKDIFRYFVDAFEKMMLNESYASIIAASQAAQFLSSIEPFAFLDDETIDDISSQISLVHYPKKMVLFIQGQSQLQYIYIIQQGAAERYYEKGGEKILRGLLAEGEVFGGISILLNDGVALRTLRTKEETSFYRLPKDSFLKLCEKNESFAEYFTDSFGKRMLNRTYASIVTKSFTLKDDSLQFLNQTVASLYTKNPIYCRGDVPIQEAARIMTRHKCGSIFILDPDRRMTGVVTDNDLRRKVISEGLNIKTPVAGIMSSPLITIPSNALVFEAMITMMEKNIKHLAVADQDGEVIGILSNRDILAAQGQSPLFLIREISNAERFEDIAQKHKRLPHLIEVLVRSGAKAGNINRFVTTISDAVLKRIIGFALKEMNHPPVDFVFMVMGSEGRKEQTLKTDQDNAIVYRDPEKGLAGEVNSYFLDLGTRVCTMLDEAGYSFCKGGIMAKNPQWCQPLSVWKEYFFRWIRKAKPHDLLKASIFFDFRGGYGDLSIIDELRGTLFEYLEGWAGFFRNMTENALHFKPPIGFFRNFVVESKGKHINQFDIKAAMQPVVDIGRIYALKNLLEETNTMQRLKQLYLKGIFDWNDFNELEHAYGFLMQLRFVRQVEIISEEKRDPDNHVNPKKLSRMEQRMLKEVFRRIEKFQDKLSLDFTGIA